MRSAFHSVDVVNEAIYRLCVRIVILQCNFHLYLILFFVHVEDGIHDDPVFVKMLDKALNAALKAKTSLSPEKLLKTLKNRTGHVIATGGGAVLDPENRAILRNLGTIIHLHTPKEIIEERIGCNHPFLPDYDNRLGIYMRLAHHNIITEDEVWEVIRLDPFSE